jgi:hypothetical protein
LIVGILAFAVLLTSKHARAEDGPGCTGSEPEPSRSAMWRVAFCNRTQHDLVIEFRDNDCPADNWTHRGDVYRKSLRRGESALVPVCYAREPVDPQRLAPGIPQLRLPSGTGVVTSWSVVGDCGEHSDRLYLDARTFYDRGQFTSGISLLQHPQSASHCIGGADSSSFPAAPVTPARVEPPPSASSPAPSASSVAPKVSTEMAPAPAVSAGQPVAAAPAMAAPAVTGNGSPSLRVVMNPEEQLIRTVRVVSTNPTSQAYRCNFTVTLTFSDGGRFSDRVKNAEVVPNAVESVVASRKYLKSVTSADLAGVSCAPR